jgi:transposase
MSAKRTYFGYTTYAQRKLLFETWEMTKNVDEACQKARMGRRTFYYWKPRFEEFGYAGLENFQSRAPKETRRTGPAIEQEVIDLYKEHPDWGKKRIADELAKANNWVPVVSLNTVKRILIDADMWPKEGKKRTGKARGKSS